jgi:TRAP-type mannitol/chloroaromatic compound transport system substrate-binding protein
MVTSWPKNRTGPGISARRIAERINAMSGGRLVIELFGAGEIVPAFAVLDVVSNGTVEAGHTAALYWTGKMPAAGLFTTVPFGLGPIEHEAWLALGGGQELWDELYRPFGVRAVLAGNTGPSMGGWFRKKIDSPDDLKGLRIRVQGLGADLYARLGAVPMSVSAGDLLPSLEKGTIDAAEFLNPSVDLETGLPSVASLYYGPGFNKPNGASEFMVGDAAWNRLPDDLKAMVRAACQAEHGAGLADAAEQNATALTKILGTYPVQLERFPPAVIEVARRESAALLQQIGATSPLAGRIVTSYLDAQRRLRGWASVNAYTTLQMSGGR